MVHFKYLEKFNCPTKCPKIEIFNKKILNYIYQHNFYSKFDRWNLLAHYIFLDK